MLLVVAAAAAVHALHQATGDKIKKLYDTFWFVWQHDSNRCPVGAKIYMFMNNKIIILVRCERGKVSRPRDHIGFAQS